MSRRRQPYVEYTVDGKYELRKSGVYGRGYRYCRICCMWVKSVGSDEPPWRCPICRNKLRTKARRHFSRKWLLELMRKGEGKNR